MERDDPRHPIQIVARRTGLTADVIRVWERRYGAVAPRRTGTNRRLYSDRDVERLLLLRRATLAGRSIGTVAAMSDRDLAAVVDADRRAATEIHGPAEGGPAAPHLRAALTAVHDLDAPRVRAALHAAAVELGTPSLLQEVLAPLLVALGEAWRAGEIHVRHEHLASSLVRSLLDGVLDALGRSLGGPEIVVATPPGDAHELGALMVAVIAAAEGWRVTNLGSDVPLEDVAGAATARGARALAMSVVYRAGDPALAEGLRALRRSMPRDVTILVGGRAAASYDAVLREIGAEVPGDLAGARAALARLRDERP